MGTLTQIYLTEGYEFLTKEPLKSRIAYLTLGGSRAYGTNLPESDVDIRGCFLETQQELFALENPKEEIVDEATDTTLYSLRKLVRLLTSCNPNVIEMLGTRDRDILYANNIGYSLRDHADLFLTKRAYYTFSGYATQQLRRLQNALARDSYSQEEKEEHILKSVKTDILTFGEPFNAFLLDKDNANNNNSAFDVTLEVKLSNSEEFSNEIFIDGTMQNLPLREFLKLNSKLQNTIRNYDKLNHRNRKKDENHLNKHAMHLIRLYYMCLDILSKGEINTYREKEHDLLMSIRHGKLPFEQVFTLQENLEKQLEEAFLNSKLPDRVDMAKVNKWLLDVYSSKFNIDLEEKL